MTTEVEMLLTEATVLRNPSSWPVEPVFLVVKV